MQGPKIILKEIRIARIRRDGQVKKNAIYSYVYAGTRRRGYALKTGLDEPHTQTHAAVT